MVTQSDIKTRIVDAYRANGIDFMSACKFADEFMRDLRKQPKGTIWHLGNKKGSILAIKNT